MILFICARSYVISATLYNLPRPLLATTFIPRTSPVVFFMHDALNYVISGTLYAEEYAGLYRAADCYVIPSRGEGWCVRTALLTEEFCDWKGGGAKDGESEGV